MVNHSMKTLYRAFTFAICVLTAQASHAQPGRDKEELSWDRNMNRIFAKYCFKCHNDNKMQGEVNLKRDRDIGMVLEHRDVWLRVGEQLEFGAMPPADAQQPDEHEAELMLQFIDTMVRKIDCGDRIEPGPSSIRRLNRAEYRSAIQVLLGIDFDVSGYLSPDTIAFGFDNITGAMSLTPTQVEQYAMATNAIIAQVKTSDTDQLTDLFSVPQIGDWRKLTSQYQDANVRDVVSRLIRLAYRRPTNEQDVQAIVDVYRAARKQELSPAAAFEKVIQAVLMSPRFLFRIEQSEPENAEPYLVEKFDLLSRLSFLLWSQPPDDVRLEYAQSHDLSDPNEVKSLANQMLHNRRSRGGIAGRFFLQWLRLTGLTSHQIDDVSFPDFDASVLKDMKTEIVNTAFERLTNDGTIDDLIASNDVWVSGRLAKYYGLQANAIDVDKFRKLDASGTSYGGLLTSGAILIATSDPNRTNVPRRGNFIASVFLGDPPPPPPPDVPKLESTANDTTGLTLRERLELHRASPDCSNCHAKMDPMGFALENYDASGRWRDLDAKKPIDASGELLDGTKFNGPVEFKQMLLSKRDQIGEHFTRQMLIYALGRGLDFRDECTVKSIVEAAKADNWKLATIVEQIAISDPFRYKINPDY
jgi:hypothetical protein